MKQKINFVKHYKNVNQKLYECVDFNPSHISLYNALFILWNNCGFDNVLSINRNDVMSLSKIGSVNTYLKCLKDLDDKGFLTYNPSHNPLKGSTVYLFRFDTSTDIVLNKYCTSTDTTTDTLYKHINKETNKQINSVDFEFSDSNELFNDTQRNLPTLRKQQKEKIDENVQEERTEILEFSFDDFWQLYPNKNNKKKAKDIFNKLKKEQREKIELHLPWFVQNKPFASYSFPHATTYLNQERYNDEIQFVNTSNLTKMKTNELEILTTEIRNRNPRL